MKILIIGSKGFIGSHCLDYFKYSHDVWGCDIIPKNEEKKHFLVDIFNPDYNHIFQTHQFDLCINCSGAANVTSSLKEPKEDFIANTINVINILEAIRLYNPTCRFMTISSAAVYGNPSVLPITTKCQPNPVSPYGFHKYFAEELCKEYHMFWGVRTCCIRVFSAYGPGLKKQLLWDLYNKFNKEPAVELWGTGDETRDFIYIADLIRAIDVIIRNSLFEAEIVNIANGQQYSIRQIATFFAKEFGASEQIINFIGVERSGDPLYWEADISKIQEWGYRPKISIEEGIKKYIQWVREEQQ